MSEENKYSLSYFLSMFCPKQSTSDNASSYNDFVSIAKVKPNISTATTSFIGPSCISPSTTMAAVRAAERANTVTLDI